MTNATSTIPEHVAQRRRSDIGVPVRMRRGPAGRLTVACILDEFSFASFGPEADFVPLTMRDWRAEITAAQPDLLLVESAWRGHRETWWNTVHRCGDEIASLLRWCNERGIPTAFWNKEDPVHFGTFLNVASRFDVVFTTDLDCVPRYKARLGHDRVHFLPFAAQPVTHNPVERFDRVDGCAFAGAYYARYPERNQDMDALAGALGELGPFEIYDRNFGRHHPDYAFPERYASRIVGGLQAREIDVAYKGYTTNLNLNSVKQSQSMFARRVFELLASNTAVVSNFSRGLRQMFGGLVVCTDDGAQLRSRLMDVRAVPNGPERQRQMALRKVMAEHTYTERLAVIAERCGIPMEVATPPTVTIVATVSDRGAAGRIRALADAQTFDRWHLVLVGPEGDAATDDDRCTVVATAAEATERIRSSSATHVAVWQDEHWYGPRYIEDLVQTLWWADVEVAGHLERYAVVDGRLVRRDESTAWTPQDRLLPARSLVALTDATDLLALLEEPLAKLTGLAVSVMHFCEHGARLGEAALAPVADLDIDAGLSIEALRAHADALDPALEQQTSEADRDVHWLLDAMPKVADLTVSTNDQGQVEVTSTLPVGSHKYVYSQKFVDLSVLPVRDDRLVSFETSTGLDVMLTFIYFDAAGTRLGHSMVANMKTTELSWPPETAKIRVGLRVSGPGACAILRYSTAGMATVPHPLALDAENLVVTNIFPSYGALYRNGFVASRLRRYRDAGFDADIVCLSESADTTSFREFDDFDVATVAPATLAATLQDGHARRVLVHFLTPATADVLRDADGFEHVTIWVHGFEVQPWWRRAFQYTTDGELEAAKELSAERIAFWRETLASAPANWHFVFVSRYLAEQVFEDVGVELPPEQYSIIHNPIDTDLFRFAEKPVEQRYRVLSIRPYTSRVYANDLSVEAVLHLREHHPSFDHFTFAFFGDGPLFDETLEPLRPLANVKIHKGFLSQPAIAEVHRDFGVFLTPSRMDTQGVSRGEAMASGLVPVTSEVAAIPEFVDPSTGFMVPGEDAVGLADAMAALADDPERFADMSRAAAQRVAAQTGAAQIIAQELALVRR